MGSVYLGYDPLLDRQVAVKVLAPHLVWDHEFVERFLREARAAARLKHPNIVTVFDVGQEGGWYYFVMEHLAGETLAARLQAQGALPAQEALSILRRWRPPWTMPTTVGSSIVTSSRATSSLARRGR